MDGKTDAAGSTMKSLVGQSYGNGDCMEGTGGHLRKKKSPTLPCNIVAVPAFRHVHGSTRIGKCKGERGALHGSESVNGERGAALTVPVSVPVLRGTEDE